MDTSLCSSFVVQLFYCCFVATAALLVGDASQIYSPVGQHCHIVTTNTGTAVLLLMCLLQVRLVGLLQLQHTLKLFIDCCSEGHVAGPSVHNTDQ